MPLIAQYCDCHLKDEKILVRFAVFDEDRPMPKQTVVVDATDCSSLAQVEDKAFSSLVAKSDDHPLIAKIKAACASGKQAAQAIPPKPDAPKPDLGKAAAQ